MLAAKHAVQRTRQLQQRGAQAAALIDHLFKQSKTGWRKALACRTIKETSEKPLVILELLL